jgi:hypothetical protein
MAQGLLVLFFIGIFVVTMPGLCCIDGCSQTFSTTSYLLQHQKKCHYVQVTQEKARHIRREKGLGTTLLKDITSVTNCKQRLQVTVLGVLCICLLINCKGILSSFQSAPQSTAAPSSTSASKSAMEVDVSEASSAVSSNGAECVLWPSSSTSCPSYWPFANATIHFVMKWLNNGETAKSETEVTKFIHEVVLSPTFNPADLMRFDAHRENQQQNKALS